MTKTTWTRGHFREQLLDAVLSDQYLTAMCLEDYIGSMSDKEAEKFTKCLEDYIGSMSDKEAEKFTKEFTNAN
jgi:dGTP triphosphohydrolase